MQMNKMYDYLWAGTSVICLLGMAATTTAQNAAPAATETPATATPAPAPARVLSDVYPTLTSGALKYARLADLPADVLLRADGISITIGDLDAEIGKMPERMREQMSKNRFGVLENMATEKLLRKSAGLGDDDAPEKLRAYLEKQADTAQVDDAAIRAFYDQNREMVGDAPYEQIKPRIEQHLLQAKKQAVIEKLIGDLGRKFDIEANAEWVKTQAALALDNPVDQARASGKPTFVNFGAEGCRPCDMMAPIREELKKEYAGKVNVVFVHVNEDQALAGRYGVRGIPYLVFFDKTGKQIHEHTGFMPKEQIEEWLKKIGAESPATNP